MTTLLSRPLAREVLLDGAPFKVMISPAGVRINRKGRRQTKEVAWDSILALGELTSAPREADTQSPKTDLLEPIAADAAKQIRIAKDALARASESLARAGALPASVLSMLEPDPVHGRVEHRSDWFIEPLLTSDELASILRISKRSVMNLSIPSITIAGEIRFRQSEIRRFLLEQERTGRGYQAR